MSDAVQTQSDLKDACVGCSDALNQLFAEYLPQLDRMIPLRLDPKLRRRVSAEDILLETYVQVLDPLQEFCYDQQTSFHIWLKLLAIRELVNTRRHHIGTQKRSEIDEVSLNRRRLPQIETASLACQLVRKFTSPTQAALRSACSGHDWARRIGSHRLPPLGAGNRQTEWHGQQSGRLVLRMLRNHSGCPHH